MSLLSLGWIIACGGGLASAGSEQSIRASTTLAPVAGLDLNWMLASTVPRSTAIRLNSDPEEEEARRC